MTVAYSTRFEDPAAIGFSESAISENISQRRERKTTELLPADAISLAGASISSTSVESISVAAMQAASFSHCNCSLTVKQLVLKASIQHCRQNQVLIGSCVFKSLVK